MLVARWIICLLTVGVLEAAACPAAPQPAAPQPSMPAQEALATLAEFLHIDVADITLVREGQTGRSEAAFGGLVRHKPPTDGPWWGPPDAAGLVECRLEVGRERGTGKPYVVLADWAIVGRSFGTPAISLEAVPDLARAFLEAYCPYLDDSVKMTYFKGFPDGESDVGMTGWTRETATTSLWIQADVRLDDGSISYGCRYRTGLTPAAITEDQARQIAEEQWRAKYPEQELVYEKTSKLLESEFSPTRGPVWMVTYRHGPEGGRTREGGTERVWLTIDAVTGAITRAPNFTPPKLTREEAQRICEEQWLAKWPDEKLELVRSAVWLDCELSPSHGPVWYLPHRRSTEGALPVSDPDLAVCIDGLTGEILGAPNLTKPKLSETDAEQIYQAEWVAKWPGDKLAPPTIRGFLDSSKSPTHGPVWVFAYQHNREGVYCYDVEVVMDALTGAILEGPDFSSGRPKQVKQ